MQDAASSCARDIERSSHSGYRSILALTSLAYTRAGQLGRNVPPAPIRTREMSPRLSAQRRILNTQPRSTPEHERQLGISFRRLYFPYTLTASLICIWPLCPFDFGESRYSWSFFKNKLVPYRFSLSISHWVRSNCRLSGRSFTDDKMTKVINGKCRLLHGSPLRKKFAGNQRIWSREE